MKTKSIKYLITLGFIVALIIVFSPETVNAQRMGHASPRGGGGGSRQAVSRPAPAPQNRSINGGSTRPAPKRPSTPAMQQNKATRLQTSSSNIQRPAANNNAKANSNNPAGGNSRDNSGSRNVNAGNKVNTGDRNINTGDRNINAGNKVNIDNSRKNINIDNSRNINVNRNVVVRPPYRPSPRPPYYYGGFHYNCFHPYHYHPYRPFYWGSMWHPWGFFVATLATTAIIISVQNQQYHYDQGVYYIQSDGGYTVVEAPVGATVKVIPESSQTVVINETTNNYYYGGTYYEKSDEGYTVVPPTAGAVVENLPEGGEEVKIGDVTYVQVGDVYYQPIEQDGKNMYEVVEVQEAEQ